MKSLSSRDLLRLLKAAGWFEVAQMGSHLHLKHPRTAGKITIPHPKKDLSRLVIKDIERKTGLRLR